MRRSMGAWLALAAAAARLSFPVTDALRSVHSHQTHHPVSRRIDGCPAPDRFGSGIRPNNNVLRMSQSPSASSLTTVWAKLTVPQLKSQLKERGLPVSGVKAELVQRLEEHEASLAADRFVSDMKEQPTTGKMEANGRRAIAFPPPKDDTEIRVIETEVRETVRMLDGLKLTNGGAPKSDAIPPSTSSRQLSRQHQQTQELMESLKASLMEQQAGEAGGKQLTFTKQSSREEKLQHYVEQLRLRPANALKEELVNLRLSSKGRKPDLVARLAEYHVARDANGGAADEHLEDGMEVELPKLTQPSLELDRPASFAGIPRLSANAANALHQAFGDGGTESYPEPTPIQSVAVHKLFYPPNPSALLHAPTGSGKTIAYLLPITETLWKEVEAGRSDSTVDVDANDMANGMALVLLPTRELAAQVAGVATVLAPPGMVKLVPRPMDLMNSWKAEADGGDEYEYSQKEGLDVEEGGGRKYQPRILVGSAKSISTSLFGDSKMPGTPTNKPQGKKLLSCTRWLVMDEVDRLLNVKKSRTDKKSRRHEKPAALLAAAVARLTLGRVQVIAASATVGRPLRRELARVLGLHSSECPETLRGEEDTAKLDRKLKSDETHVGRAVKIPDAVRNYVLPVDGSTTGSLLTSAAFASKTLLQPAPGQEASSRRVLVVLTRNCDIKVHNALGALRHFGIRPEPQSLLDALEADGTDRLVEAHRKVSGVEGVGGARQRTDGLDGDDGEGYLLVTHEDNVRGLHLDSLDAVIVVGRPGSPDEYTHIAGRTGRAGRRGSVLNVVSFEQAAALASWTKMLGVDFLPVDESEVAGIVDDEE
ncbi:hypothetical protein ACHAXT_006098 [Thalassiosira profunda]